MTEYMPSQIDNKQDTKIEMLENKASEFDTAIKLISQKLDAICEAIADLKKQVSDGLVTKADFNFFKEIVYERLKSLENNRNWIAGIIVGAVISAVLKLLKLF